MELNRGSIDIPLTIIDLNTKLAFIDYQSGWSMENLDIITESSRSLRQDVHRAVDDRIWVFLHFILKHGDGRARFVARIHAAFDVLILTSYTPLA